jgi:nucleoside-diphosphate-sugar epimerase
MAFVKAYEILSTNRSIHSEQFGVASGRKIRLKDLIEIFEKVTNKRINVCWGGREYRKREVMELWDSYKLLPNWKCTISLEEGLKRYSIHN